MQSSPFRLLLQIQISVHLPFGYKNLASKWSPLCIRNAVCSVYILPIPFHHFHFLRKAIHNLRIGLAFKCMIAFNSARIISVPTNLASKSSLRSVGLYPTNSFSPLFHFLRKANSSNHVGLYIFPANSSNFCFWSSVIL